MSSIKARIGCVVVPMTLVVVAANMLGPSLATAQRATWTMRAAPTVRLGTSDKADQTFEAPAGATRLPNGNIVVGDLGDWALREFTPQGALVKKYGRKGKGPGEVTYLQSLLRCGNELVAYDIAGLSSIYTLDGTFVRGFRFPKMPYRLSCNAAGQVMTMGWPSDKSRQPGIYRGPIDFWIAHADSTPITALGTFSGGERWAARGDRPYPLGLDPRSAIGRTRAYVALSDSFDIKVFDFTGASFPSWRSRALRVEATKADWDNAMELEIASMGEGSRGIITSTYASMPRAKLLPATRELIVDADDNLWVEHFPRAAETTTRWTVFAPDGKVRATVTLPQAFTVYEIGKDYLLGRYINKDEAIPEVRLYALIRK